MNIDLWTSIDARIQAGRLWEAIQFLETKLVGSACSRFASLIGANFDNDPNEIAREVSAFVRKCEEDFRVESVYLEMNGFDINPDRWYFDLFGYRTYTDDPADIDWLADWDSQPWPDVTLTGLESAQADFAWLTGNLTQGYKDKTAKQAAEYATLLVMCKFALLIEKAVNADGLSVRVPILATAHDFDIVPRFAA